MSDLVGQTIGAYEIIENVGQGGMARVYRAHHSVVDRDVAIKVLSSDLARDERFVARFEREAKILASLQHIHILPVFDYGHHRDMAYLVMPFISTGTLKNYLNRKKLSLKEINRLIEQIASGLDFAHRHDIYHRDIKPSNVLLDGSRNALIADFGLARLAKGDSNLTDSGHTLGTPYYMSPEQVQGHSSDYRSDIYAMGVMLYEMATGKVPFDADTPLAIAYKHVTETPPTIEEDREDLPIELNAIIRKAMAKAPGDRYQTCNEMALALADLLRPTTDTQSAVAVKAGAVTEPVTPIPPMRTIGVTGTQSMSAVVEQVRTFISYSRDDKELASKIVSKLERIYKYIWFDRELIGGQDWWQEIHRQIAECSVFIYLVSSKSIDSQYCQNEINAALTLNKFIIPVMIEPDVPIPSLLERIHAIDMSSGSLDDGFMDLLKAIIHRPTTFMEFIDVEGMTATEIQTRGVPPSPSWGETRALVPDQIEHKLVGREELLRDLKKRLLSHKELALYGIPGVGKSALTVTLAHDPEVRTHFYDGVLWVSLGRAPNILTELGIWADTLGIPEEDFATVTDVRERAQAVKEAIGDRHLLLVIDDAWTAQAAAAFRIGGPNCGYLLTTRLPEIAIEFSTEDAIQVSELNVTDGLMLLQQFAPEVVKVEPDRALTLVKSVGALPLALMLIGKHLKKKVRVGQPGRLVREIKKLERAESRLNIDSAQPSDESITSISLQAVISVSDEALPSSTRQTLRKLSLFPSKPNTFSEDAALEVAEADIDELDHLLDYGLIEATMDVQDNQRYALHQTITDYARSQLGDDEPVQRRMMTYYRGYVEKKSGDYNAIEAEQGNIVSILNAGRAEDAKADARKTFVSMVNRMYRYWEAKGLYDMAEEYLQSAESIAGAIDNRLGQAEASLNLGRISEKRGDLAGAKEYLGQGVKQLADDTSDEAKHIQLHLLTGLGLVAAYTGGMETAEQRWQEALQAAIKINDRERISTLKMNLGLLAAGSDPEQAVTYYQESLEMARSIDNKDIVSHVLQNLGTLEASRDHYEEARSYFEESLKVAQDVRNLERTSEVYLNLGQLASEQGDYDTAEEQLKEALYIAIEMDNPAIVSHVLMNLGSLFNKQGDYREALDYLKEAQEIVQEKDIDPWIGAWIAAYIGEAYLGEAETDEAKKSLETVIKESEEAGFSDVTAMAQYFLARVYAAQKDTVKAKTQAEASIKAFEEEGDGKHVKEVRDWLKTLG